MNIYRKLRLLMARACHKFVNLSIFKKLLFIILFVFLAIFSLSMLSFNKYKADKENDIKKHILQVTHQTNGKIDNYLSDLDRITILPLTHKPSGNNYIHELSAFNSNGTRSLTFQEMNENMFYEILTYKPAVSSCYVFNMSGDADYKVETPIYSAFNPSEEDWFQETIRRFGKSYIIDTYKLPNTTSAMDHYVFGVARGIVKLEDAEVIGLLLINTDVSYLREICNDMKLSDNNRIIILHDDAVIYDTEETNIASSVEDSFCNYFNNIPDNITVTETTIDNQSVYASSILSDYSGWRIISIIPTKDLYEDINQMRLYTMLVTVIILFITIIIIWWISRQIVRPIKKLQMLMKLTESGDFNQKINITTHDEIGNLAASFNHMTSKIDTLIQEVYLSQIKQGEAELQMLQSQINPHFLYNTLESISMMAIINDDDTTSEMANDLGKILYYGISKNKTEVTLAEEISVLERYIHLQDVRFHNSYLININIPDNLKEIIIIKLILQPIVENAIYHGMNTIRNNGLITIFGYRKDSTLFLCVEDNGIGMDEVTLNALNGYINDENDKFKSIGLRNVNKRIKLRYGNTFGLHIESSPANGTKVTVSLPIESENSYVPDN